MRYLKDHAQIKEAPLVMEGATRNRNGATRTEIGTDVNYEITRQLIASCRRTNFRCNLRSPRH